MYSQEEYLKQHPNCSLAEYINYKQITTKEEAKLKQERIENIKQWYNNLVGKYFIINFNGVSFIAVHINTPINPYSVCTDYEVYDICANNFEKYYSIRKEKRPVNRFWFQNPYEFGNSHYTKVKEITREYYNSIGEIYNVVKGTIESLNLK